jgi:hypothetical protein
MLPKSFLSGFRFSFFFISVGIKIKIKLCILHLSDKWEIFIIKRYTLCDDMKVAANTLCIAVAKISYDFLPTQRVKKIIVK